MMRDHERRRMIRELLIALEGACWYCGCPLGEGTPISATIDHFVPTSGGGGEQPGNFRLCCRRCNRRKSDRDVGWCIFTLNRQMMFGRQRRGFLRRLAGRIGEPIHAADVETT